MIFSDASFYQQNTPSQGKIMALDLGTVRIGVASCDFTQTLISPNKIITRQNKNADFAEIFSFIEENAVKAIVLGMPTHMDGKAVEMTKIVQNFAHDFDEFLGHKLPIFLFDERLSSFEAKEIAREIPRRKKQKHVDDIAACVILRGFLDVVGR